MKKIIQFTIALLFSSLTLFGQTKETKTADAFFTNLSYIKASEAYEELAKKNPTEHVLKRLGDSYYYNVFMQKASESYAKLFESYTPDDAEYMFKYAQSLRATGNFDDSKLWMEKFHKAKKEDARGVNFTNKEADLLEIKEGEPLYEVTNLKNINTELSDFGVTEFNNTILFASPARVSKFVKRAHTRNQKNFLDIYQVDRDKMNSIEDRISFSEEVNEKYHESSVSFSPDKKTMYFTRNNYNEGSYKVDKKGYNKLKIYKAELIDNKWKNIKELPFCSNEYSVGHPSVSKDGKRLYFTSDMPGSLGETDIYYVEIKDNNSYGYIQNLGISVNTEGREMFPYISEDDVLYFSSDGHFGIGALDVFASKKENGFFGAPINLKAPINSKLDDFAFSINPFTKKGYLSSNREGGVGDDDIYSVVEFKVPEPPKPPCMQAVSGIVSDTKFKNPLPGARLILKDENGLVVKDTIVGSFGDFSFQLPCNKTYMAYATKEYYQPDSDSFVTTEAAKVDLDLDFKLEIADEFSYNERNELIIKIRPIYFDYNKSNIRPDAASELDLVYAVMNQYPRIEVRGSSHTDARGKAAYNEALSKRRAVSTVNYVISRGISNSRIVAKGFGETQLTNNCMDNDRHTNRVKCTKEQHQANRRTEFVITKM